MKRLRKYLFENGVALGVLCLSWLVVVALTLQRGTMLLGWDNVQADLDPQLHLLRSFFAVWEEYQGLGLLGGMAHATDLVRALVYMMLQIFMPMEWIRWSWFLGLLLWGILGAYVLLQQLLGQLRLSKPLLQVASMVGAWYYFFSLATGQLFYLPLETFAAFYAFLPWMIWSVVWYLEKITSKRLLVVLVINFVGSMAFYVQTLFVVYAVLLGILAVTWIWFHHRRRVEIKKMLMVLIAIVIANTYWLLPMAYFSFTQADVVVQAKQNMLSTRETELMNMGRGKLTDVALLRGYWLDYSDFDLESGAPTYLLSGWKDWVQDSQVEFIGLLLFSAALLGITFGMFRYRSWWVWMLVSWLVVGLVMLARDNGLIQWLYTAIGELLPFFGQMFRSAFTKWSVVMALIYAGGLSLLVVFIGTYYRRLATAIGGLLMLMSVVYVWPITQGEFIHSPLATKLPKQYIKLFDFFAAQPPHKRIVHLPMPSFWGWEFYDWGYRGSGFLWYGIEQPILNRAFDVWSRENETFYHELSTAVYQCPLVESDEVGVGSQGFEICVNQIVNILQNYQVGYVLLDEHVIQPGQDETLLRRDEIRRVMEILQLPLVFEQDGILVWQIPASIPETFQLVEGESIYTRKNVMGEEGDYISPTQISDLTRQVKNEDTTPSDSPLKRGRLEFPFAQVYREEIQDIHFVDSGFGSDEVEFESREMAVEEGSWLVVPGMALGFGVSLFGEVAYEPGQVRIGLEPGISLKWQDEALQTDVLKQEIVLPVDTDTQELFVQVADEVVRVRQGELVVIEGVSARVGESLGIQVFDAVDQYVVDTTANFSEVEMQQCWVRDGYTPVIEEEYGQDMRQYTVSNASACLPLKLDLPIEEVGLMEVRLPYRSERARPHFCVTREGAADYRCLHDEVFYAEEASGGEWDEIQRYISKAGGESYWMDVVARPSDMADDPWSIDYASPRVSFWPLIASTKVNEEWWKSYRQQQEFAVSGSGKLVVSVEVEPEEIRPATISQSQVKNCDVFGRGEVGKQMSLMRFTDPNYSRATIFYRASNRGAACDSIVLPNISTQREYILRLSGEGMAGRGLKFYLNNLASGRNDLEILLSEGEFDSAFGLLAWPGYTEDTYALNLETRSFGSEESVNRLDQVRVYPVSLGWLARVRVEPENGRTELVQVPTELVRKWGTSHYQFKIQKSKVKIGESRVIVLDQGYDEGWLAYEISQKSQDTNSKEQTNTNDQFSKIKMLMPWFYGDRLEQVKVNGWANGWLVNDSTPSSSPLERGREVVVVYWPQYLEWLGLGVLGITFGVLMIVTMKKSRAATR